MARMSLAEFEELYRAEPDPWGYTTSDYEREKYQATLAACGDGPFSEALELGGSIGVFSELLAPRCERLTTIDGAPTAVSAARRRLASFPKARALVGPIPAAVPERNFDLVVASEILYYLSTSELGCTLTRLRSGMVQGARLVAVHWRPPGRERPLDADQVHRALHEQPWLRCVLSDATDAYLLDVLERR